MTNQQFDTMRREYEITSVELANYAGASVKELLAVETGRAPVQDWMIKVLQEMINKKNV